MGLAEVHETVSGTVSVSRQTRSADVYVFAWHGKQDKAFADHRTASQWEFLVASESELPTQQSISLTPLRNLARRCTYRSLANNVEEVPTPSQFKARQHAVPEPCPHCAPETSSRTTRTPRPVDTN